MSTNTIEIENNKYKNYEILALLLHIYNNNNVITDMYESHSQTYFYFANVKESSSNYIQPNKDYGLRDQLIRTRYHKNENLSYDAHKHRKLLTVDFELVPNKDSISIPMKFGYEYNIDYELISHYYQHPTVNLIYDKMSSKKTPDEKMKKFAGEQNKLVDKFKFFETYSSILNEKIYIGKNMNQIYKFKKYITNILEYENEENYDFINEFFNFIKENIAVSKTFIMNKLLYIRRHQDDIINLSIHKITNKSFNVFSYNSSFYTNPFFDIFIPIFKQLGGLKELEKIILTQRLIEE